jgi:xylose isomerase
VKDFARGCMRTYSILKEKEKGEHWNGDREIQSILKEISRATAKTPLTGRYTHKGSAALLSYAFDIEAILKKRLPYELLDQLTVDVLVGIR